MRSGASQFTGSRELAGSSPFAGSWQLAGRVFTAGTNPLDASRQAASGTVSTLGTYALFIADLDGDGTRDSLDTDVDGDGAANGSDNCLTLPNPYQLDCDHDGTGDACDAQTVDVDADQAADACDNCSGLSNPSQSNTDNDAFGDLCDVCPSDTANDSDSDGICAGLGFRAPKIADRDNCPGAANPSQRDLDQDGVGDACDSNPVLRVSSKAADVPDFGTIQAAVNAAVQAGTRIDILPGLGPYLESVRLDRGLVLRLVRRDDGSGNPVVIDGGSGVAIDLVATGPSGTTRLENLTLRGRIGIRSSTSSAAPVFGDTVRFESISERAADLGPGAHALHGITTGASVAAGVRIASGGNLVVDDSALTGIAGTALQVNAGASLFLDRSTLTGITGTALQVSGQATVLTSLLAGSGAGIAITAGGSLDLEHTTVAGNAGAGVSAAGGASATLEHAIVYANTGGDLFGVACSALSWSDVGTVNCSGVNNNQSVNPLFVGGGNYHLQSGSPCLDHGPDPTLFAGDPCLDLDATPRLLDYDGDGTARIDPGAYEKPNPSPAPVAVSNLRWTGPTMLAWDAAPSAVSYHLYRGAAAALGYGNYGVCRDDLDPVRTDTSAMDTDMPATATSFFYLVTAVNGSNHQGSLGLGTCAERSRLNSCP